jgi:hypothetical protein
MALCSAGSYDTARELLDPFVSDRFASIPLDLTWSTTLASWSEVAFRVGTNGSGRPSGRRTRSDCSAWSSYAAPAATRTAVASYSSAPSRPPAGTAPLGSSRRPRKHSQTSLGAETWWSDPSETTIRVLPAERSGSRWRAGHCRGRRRPGVRSERHSASASSARQEQSSPRGHPAKWLLAQDRR